MQLAFLDFSTLERRRTSCEDEIRLNRRLAPELYLDVVTIGGSESAPQLGAEPALEYAVRMREFPAKDRLDRALAAGRLEPGHWRDFAARMAAFHESEPPCGQASEPASGPGAEPGDASTADATPSDPAAAEPPELAALRRNLDETRAALAQHEQAGLEAIDAWLAAQSERLAAAFRSRRAAGRVRDCHGDLHLENLVLLDERIVAFDALEFNTELRQIDVIDEAAFLCMDLAAHGRPDFAALFLNSYLEATGDYAGLVVLDAYRLHRALVRAKVRAIRRQQTGEPGADGTAPYLAAARAAVASRPPRLLLMRGLSGSGKTHVAQALVTTLPAVSVRSDIERKRLFDLAPTAASGSGLDTGIYTPAASERTYGVLEAAASAALEGGLDIIVDAAFLSRERRKRFARLAAAHGARFAILDCRADEGLLRERIAARRAEGRDASEADTTVLDEQLRQAESLDAQEESEALSVDTSGPLDAEALAARIRARL